MLVNGFVMAKQRWKPRIRRLHTVGTGLEHLANKHNSHTTIGIEEDDAIVFERPTNLIARGLVYLEAAFGFEAFEGGQ